MAGRTDGCVDIDGMAGLAVSMAVVDTLSTITARYCRMRTGISGSPIGSSMAGSACVAKTSKMPLWIGVTTYTGAGGSLELPRRGVAGGACHTGMRSG